MDIEIEELHKLALQNNSKVYQDPETGFTVWTEIAHLKRGKCCGNRCRHCPYGWTNVPTKKGFVEDDEFRKNRPTALVESGDKKAAHKLLEEIQTKYQTPDPLNDGNSETKDQKAEKNTANNAKCEDNCKGNCNNNAEDGVINVTQGKGGHHGGTLTKKNVPYTRSGDKGTTQLFNGERRRKDDDAFECMGSVDELCSVTGVVHAELMSNIEQYQWRKKIDKDTEELDYGELPEWLLNVMSRLFDIGSHVAKPRAIYDCEEKFEANGVGGGFNADYVDELEIWIDIMTEALPDLDSFIMPTGGKVSAQLHVARTVCRRAERKIVSLVNIGVCDPMAMQYLNRLSDFFFTASRWANYCEGREEIMYRRDFRGATQRYQVQRPLKK